MLAAVRAVGGACSRATTSCAARPLRCDFPSNKRCASSNSRWKARQGRDVYAREAKVQGLKSRAAFKLLEVREPAPSCRNCCVCPTYTVYTCIRSTYMHPYMHTCLYLGA